MADPKLPKPPVEEDDDDNFEADLQEEDSPQEKKVPAWQSWVRIGLIATFFLFALVVIASMCNKCASPVPPPMPNQLVDTANIQPKPQIEQPASVPVPPQSQPVEKQVQATHSVSVGEGKILALTYIIRNGNLANGETTVALLRPNGSVSINVNGEFFDIDNPQLTKKGGDVVAIHWGNTTYVVNEDIAKTLGLESRSPYSSGGKRVKDVHIVRSGETADGIRKKYGMKSGELKELNRSYDLNYLTVGQKLNIYVTK
jgi:LysM repeat protein